MTINVEEFLGNNTNTAELFTANREDFENILQIVADPRCRLTSLIITRNLTDADAVNLATALAHNTTITSLDVDGNQIGAALREELKQVAQNNLARKTEEMKQALSKGDLSLVDTLLDVPLDQFKESGLLSHAEKMFAAKHPISKLKNFESVDSNVIANIISRALPKRWPVCETNTVNTLAKGIEKHAALRSKLRCNQVNKEKRRVVLNPQATEFIPGKMHIPRQTVPRKRRHWLELFNESVASDGLRVELCKNTFVDVVELKNRGRSHNRSRSSPAAHKI